MSAIEKDRVLPNSWAARAALFAFVVCLAVIAAWAYRLGGRALADTQAAEANAVAGENRAFCTGLGFADKSNEFARCTKGLSDIRQKQKERWEADAVDLL
jgi:hypothetical protein